jgi:hypothetical protein
VVDEGKYRRVCKENEELRTIARDAYELLDSVLLMMSMTDEMACMGFFIAPLVADMNQRLTALGVDVPRKTGRV